MVAYQIAIEAGINMSECKAQKFNNDNYTFLTKRFDREGMGRIHYASAMTCLGKVDGNDQGSGVSYLDLAEFIIHSGSNVNEDLEELWRRIVLSICISNVDDHLRNHGFLSEHDNSQSLELALSVIEYFRIDNSRAKEIIEDVKKSVAKWRAFAHKLGISASKQDLMARAFRVIEE